MAKHLAPARCIAGGLVSIALLLAYAYPLLLMAKHLAPARCIAGELSHKHTTYNRVCGQCAGEEHVCARSRCVSVCVGAHVVHMAMQAPRPTICFRHTLAAQGHMCWQCSLRAQQSAASYQLKAAYTSSLRPTMSCLVHQ